MSNTPLKPKATDWDRVKRGAASNSPVEDPLGPYDPNDPAAVSDYWKTATITRGRGGFPVVAHGLSLIHI